MITLKSDKSFTESETTELFKSVGWESANYPQKLFLSLKNSENVLCIYDGAKLAGLMSAISDGGMNVYFPYLLIHPDYQGNGLGKRLVTKMFEIYSDFYRKILICSNEKKGFYSACGMSVQDDQSPMIKIN